jgi:hypothetical protein
VVTRPELRKLGSEKGVEELSINAWETEIPDRGNESGFRESVMERVSRIEAELHSDVPGAVLVTRGQKFLRDT